MIKAIRIYSDPVSATSQLKEDREKAMSICSYWLENQLKVRHGASESNPHSQPETSSLFQQYLVMPRLRVDLHFEARRKPEDDVRPPCFF